VDGWITALAGVGLGAALSEARAYLDATRRRRWAREDETRERHLLELQQTRRLLHATVDQAQALAVGDLGKARAAGDVVHEQEFGNLRLVGDDETVESYQGLVVHLNNRFGLGLRVEDRIRAFEVMDEVNAALSLQEERVRVGRPLEVLSPAIVERLKDVRGMSRELVAFNQPPSVVSRLTRFLIERVRYRG
jgi:hypothetical protein